uniref:Cleavage and polyadenylation specificity factor subunit 6 n=1 Tax=Myotis lucifugus TaxID=59463 RepID=G1Q0C9_MYOLU
PSDGVDNIDIYADVDEEFNQEAEYGGHGQIDLYDGVISPSANNGDAPEDRDYRDTLRPAVGDDVGKEAAPKVVYTYTRKRIALYIGNLTWWTTDEDLTEAVHSLGVNDILEIMFFENRANGQSKGFALVGLGSESSSKKLMDLLPKRELHGQNPVVTPCSKQFLSQFEMQSRKRGRSCAAFPQGGRGRGRFPGAVPSGDRFPGSAGPGGQPPPFPAGQTPPPSLGPLLPGPPPPVPGYGPPPGPPHPQKGPPPPPGPFHLIHLVGPPLTLAPPPHLPGPPPGAPPPAPHVNPAFFPPPTNSGMPTSDSRGPPPIGSYGRPPPYDRGDYGPPGRKMDTARTPLSEAEFEEIMNKNRAISSSAISKAMSDASAGDYGSAIETLVTAISLVKQSKVSADDRCKVLGSGSRRKGSRERDHSRSREKSRRHKSRSRDRHDDDYRERRRERERHHDRDRDRDR